MSPKPDLPPRDVIEKLGALELEKLDGSTIRLDELWQDSAVVFYFLRHYG